MSTPQTNVQPPPPSPQTQSSSNNNYTITPLTIKPPFLRLDVYPFILLYLIIHILISPYSNSSDLNDLSVDNTSDYYYYKVVTYRLTFGLTLFAHVICFLLSQWSVHAQRVLGYDIHHYLKTTSKMTPTHVFISPPPNSSLPSIVPISTVNSYDSKSGEVNGRRLTAEYSNVIFECTTLTPPFTFNKLKYPIANKLSSYTTSRGLQTPLTILAAFKIYGSNAKNLPLPPILTLLLSQLLAPFFIFQILCCLLWCLDEYWYYSIFTFLMLLFFELTLAFTRLKSLERLRSNLSISNIIFVYRCGVWRGVDGCDLLVGDIISLIRSNDEEDVQVPCDLLLLKGNIVVNEAMLTGESVPQIKEPVVIVGDGNGGRREECLDLEDGRFKRCVIFGGTVVVDHNNTPTSDSDSVVSHPPNEGCICSILRTGFSTQQGTLLQTLAHTSTSTPVNTSDTFIFILLLLCFALVASAVVVLDGISDENRNKFRLLLHTVIILTSVVPPELPMELSLAVTNSLKSLMMKSIFCTEAFRIPLAGKVDVCCFDKTGTLTSDEMVLKGVIVEGGLLIDPSSSSSGEDKSSLPVNTMRVLAACHSIALSNGDVIGDPLEVACLASVGWAVLGKDVVAPTSTNDDDTDAGSGKEDERIHIVHRYPFESRLKRMSVIVTTNTNASANADTTSSNTSTSTSTSTKSKSTTNTTKTMMILTKGAPEALKPLLSPSSLPDDFDLVSRTQMAKGRRVLCLAFKTITSTSSNGIKSTPRSTLETNLTFSGFIVLTCPIKPDTQAVIKELRNSNHRCIMITGDATLTAAEVGRKVGIMRSEGEMTLELVVDDGGVGKGVVWRHMGVTLEDGDGGSGSGDIKHVIGDENAVLELIGKGYELCISGDVLMLVAALSSKSSSSSSKDNKNIPSSASSSSSSTSTLSSLSYLIKHTTIFARHSPSQKETILASLNQSGFYTLMCGDGTNDVGALKMAHVGISLVSVPGIERRRRVVEGEVRRLVRIEKREKKGGGKSRDKSKGKSKHGKNEEEDNEEGEDEQTQALRQTQRALHKQTLMTELKQTDLDLTRTTLGFASVASPFTSRSTSITCCRQTILQGRCTLVTMLQIYKILGVNCLVTALSLSVLKIVGVKQGDAQLTFVGVLVAILFFLLSLAKPLSVLSKMRPPSSVLCGEALLSITMQFTIHLACILITITIALKSIDELDPTNTPDGIFTPSPLNSSSFLITLCATITTFLVNYRGEPYMQSLRDNKMMLRGMQGCYLILFVMVTEVFPPLNQMLQLAPLPSGEISFDSDGGDGDSMFGAMYKIAMLMAGMEFEKIGEVVGLKGVVIFVCCLDVSVAWMAENWVLRRVYDKVN